MSTGTTSRFSLPPAAAHPDSGSFHRGSSLIRPPTEEIQGIYIWAPSPSVGNV